MGMETALLIGGLAASTFGTVTSTIAQLNQADRASKEAMQNATIANQNAQLAEEDARQARKEGYENKLKKRQEVAGLIGSQRASQGASGALVDSGSFMDTTLDSVDKGEADALKMEQDGYDRAYAKELEAYNYRQQANNLQWQAKQSKKAKTGILVSGGLSLLGSAVSAGSNWYDRKQMKDVLTTAKPKETYGQMYDRVHKNYFG